MCWVIFCDCWLSFSAIFSLIWLIWLSSSSLCLSKSSLCLSSSTLFAVNLFSCSLNGNSNKIKQKLEVTPAKNVEKQFCPAFKLYEIPYHRLERPGILWKIGVTHTYLLHVVVKQSRRNVRILYSPLYDLLVISLASSFSKAHVGKTTVHFCLVLIENNWHHCQEMTNNKMLKQWNLQ